MSVSELFYKCFEALQVSSVQRIYCHIFLTAEHAVSIKNRLTIFHRDSRSTFLLFSLDFSIIIDVIRALFAWHLVFLSATLTGLTAGTFVKVKQWHNCYTITSCFSKNISWFVNKLKLNSDSFVFENLFIHVYKQKKSFTKMISNIYQVL